MRLLLTLFLLAQQTPTVSPGNGTVTGVLRTSDGKPAAGVRVAAMAPSDSSDAALQGAEMMSLGMTDAKGRYQLDNVPPGRYYITAGRLDTPTYFPGTLERSSGRVVALSPSSEVTDVNFVLKDESIGRVAVSDLMFFSSLRPGLTVPVAVTIDGAGKVPIFSNGISPVLRLTAVSGGKIYEELFSSLSFTLPMPVGTTVDEYRVSVDGLPDGYSVQTIKIGITDGQKETLKFSRGALVMGQGQLRTQPGETALTQSVLSVVLAGSLSGQNGPAAAGANVRGSSFGNGGEIYISNVPGTLYSDGTFEFRGVPPGLHTIVKSVGSSATVASVFVGSQNVEGVRMQITPVLPIGILSDEPALTGKIPEAGVLALSTLRGRLVDEVSKEPITEGTVIFTGYGNSRRTAAMDGEGRFEISQLLPGEYKLEIHVSGYIGGIRDVSVGIEDLKLDLIVQREAR